MKLLTLLLLIFCSLTLFSCNGGGGSDSSPISDENNDNNDDTPTYPQLTLGGAQTCIQTAASELTCWGDNSNGQLGLGHSTATPSPTDVSSLTSTYSIKQMALGCNHSCFLTTSGGVKCMGDATYVGDGSSTYSKILTPVDVTGLQQGVSKISLYCGHSCALLSTGGVKCWGSNSDGQLGDGSTTTRYSPVDVVGLSSGVKDIIVGGDHTCALLDSGGVKCWGANDFGMLGDGTKINRSSPVTVSGLSGVTSISGGGYKTCALLSSGGVKCWGSTVGDGTYDDRTTPTQVTGLTSGVIGITSGWSFNCALLSSGGVKCWGDTTTGQLGDGNQYALEATPIDVTGLSSGVSLIRSGTDHTCVLMNDKTTLKCWGSNGSGQIGDGTTSFKTTPYDVTY